MSLLAEIQEGLLTEGSSLGPILLKLRFLASRLGSAPLEEWVRHETDGYPKEVEVPEYRKAVLTYTGTFHSVAHILNNVSVPNYMIAQHAGQSWVNYEIRDSLSVIDSIIIRAEKGAMYAVNVAVLELLLQEKLMEHHTLIQLNGRFSIDAFVRIQGAVRAQVLDLTLKLDKEVPSARDVVLSTKPDSIKPSDSAKVTQATQQVFYGPVTNINNSTVGGALSINVMQGDIQSFINSLVHQGVPEKDAQELAAIVRTDQAAGPSEPLGKRATQWLGEKIRSGATDTWKIAKGAAIGEIIKLAVKGYLGIP